MPRPALMGILPSNRRGVNWQIGSRLPKYRANMTRWCIRSAEQQRLKQRQKKPNPSLWAGTSKCPIRDLECELISTSTAVIARNREIVVTLRFLTGRKTTVCESLQRSNLWSCRQKRQNFIFKCGPRVGERTCDFEVSSLREDHQPCKITGLFGRPCKALSE